MPSNEGFYLDKNGKKQDALFHGDVDDLSDSYKEDSRRSGISFLLDEGFTQQSVESTYGPIPPDLLHLVKKPKT